MSIKVNFGYYRCPNAQRRFRHVMDKFMSERADCMTVATIEPAALREFPAYVKYNTTGASVTSIQKQPLTDAERVEALEFDDDALIGGVQERLFFTVVKTNLNDGAQG